MTDAVMGPVVTSSGRLGAGPWARGPGILSAKVFKVAFVVARRPSTGGGSVAVLGVETSCGKIDS